MSRSIPSHKAEPGSPGSNDFVKQFANASALDYLEKFRPSHQRHEKHLQKIKASCISVCRRLVTVSLMDAISLSSSRNQLVVCVQTVRRLVVSDTDRSKAA